MKVSNIHTSFDSWVCLFFSLVESWCCLIGLVRDNDCRLGVGRFLDSGVQFVRAKIFSLFQSASEPWSHHHKTESPEHFLWRVNIYLCLLVLITSGFATILRPANCCLVSK